MRRIEVADDGALRRKQTARSKRATAVAALGAGLAVAAGLGLYAGHRTATGTAPLSLGFAQAGDMKIWLTRGAIALGLFQLGSGLRMRGKIPFPRRLPGWFRPAHRASGALAILLALPVAYDCLAAFGLQVGTPRLAAHAFAGLALFGAFAGKLVSVERHRRPGWLIPAAGLALFAALAVAWLTSIGWTAPIY